MYKPDSTQIDYHIRYDATIRIGIDMGKVTFKVNEQNKTITPVLPKIEITQISLDPSNIGFIPANAMGDLKQAFAVCKEDIQKEANETKELYDIAGENIRSTMEALLYPILDANEYAVVWGE